MANNANRGSPRRTISMERQGSASLDARDERLALLLAKGSTRASAAKELGMGLRTVYTKLTDPAFKQLVNDLRSQMLDQAVGQLVASGSDAIAVLKELMASPLSVPSTRLRAAVEILDAMMKLGDYSELVTRLAELEKRIVERESQDRET